MSRTSRWSRTVFKPNTESTSSLQDGPLSRNSKNAIVKCKLRSCGKFLPLPGQQLKRCGKCMASYYCNAEHQRADWKEHKPSCDLVSHTHQALSRLTPDDRSMPSYHLLGKLIDDWDKLHAYSIRGIISALLEMGGPAVDTRTHFVEVMVTWRSDSGGNPALAFKIHFARCIPDGNAYDRYEPFMSSDEIAALKDGFKVMRDAATSQDELMKSHFAYRGCVLCSYKLCDVFTWTQTYTMWSDMFPVVAPGTRHIDILKAAYDMINSGFVLRQDDLGNWGPRGEMVRLENGSWMWKQKTGEQPPDICKDWFFH